MAIRKMSSDSDAGRPVTPMSEIRRRKSITLDEFDRRYPEFEWTAGRQGILLQDHRGGLWVPLVDPLYGLYYEFDDPELTPEIEEALAADLRRSRESVPAGNFVYFHELDQDESFWDDD
ncbi:MAG: hypothetical protein OXG27_00250 [Chloroflexi bacterium]|nr:hypothetical protein [Chloroflexota bacterium]